MAILDGEARLLKTIDQGSHFNVLVLVSLQLYVSNQVSVFLVLILEHYIDLNSR